jgi:GNAT superfamily N-acetyltransferase
MRVTVQDIETYAERSPLVYDRSDDVHRFALFSRELVDVPFEPRDTYFTVTERVHRYGKNNRRLKTPKIEIIPGARPGTLAWVDWHWVGPRYIYIDFMKVRNDWRGRGAGRQLVEAFYANVVAANAVENIHWGRVMSEYAWKIFNHMRRLYPNVHHAGHVDF